jgi:putative transcriptional regulator
MAIHVNLDRLLLDRSLTLTELSDRFSTLSAICGELGCQPGDLLEFKPDE